MVAFSAQVLFAGRPTPPCVSPVRPCRQLHRQHRAGGKRIGVSIPTFPQDRCKLMKHEDVCQPPPSSLLRVKPPYAVRFDCKGSALNLPTDDSVGSWDALQCFDVSGSTPRSCGTVATVVTQWSHRFRLSARRNIVFQLWPPLAALVLKRRWSWLGAIAHEITLHTLEYAAGIARP
jgi:hypothetical protein